MSVSVIGASIPSIFYLVKRGISVLFPNQPSSSKRSSAPSNTFLSNRRNQTKSNENGEFARLENEGSESGSKRVAPGTNQAVNPCAAGKERDLELGERPGCDEEAVLPRSQIHVRSDLDVSYNDFKRADL